jgi:hypothetical protein
MSISNNMLYVARLKVGQNRCPCCGSDCFSICSNNRVFNRKFNLKKFNSYTVGSLAESLSSLSIRYSVFKKLKNFVLSGYEMSVTYNNNDELKYKVVNNTKLKRNFYSKEDLSSLHKSESLYFSDLLRGVGVYQKDLCYIFCEKCDWFKGVCGKDSEPI